MELSKYFQSPYLFLQDLKTTQKINLMDRFGKESLVSMLKSCDEAAKLDLFDIFKELYAKNPQETEVVTYFAAQAGRLDILEWAASINIKFNPFTCQAALRKNFNECYEFALKHAPLNN